MLSVVAYRLAYMQLSTFSDRFIYALKKANLTQSKLARLIGLTSQAVNGWATGKTKSIEGEHLLTAAAALGVNALWLATARGPMCPSAGQTQAEIIPGFTTLSVPDELLPLYEAGIRLYLNRNIPPDFIEHAVLMVKSLNPARLPPGSRSPKEDQRSE